MRHIGVIAEEDGDVGIIRCIIGKLTRRAVKVDQFVGHGCAKVRAKCHAWGVTLHGMGCNHLIIVHDLDNENIDALRNKLSELARNIPISMKVIVIPVQEIEAWLLADHEAIQRAMNLPIRLNKISNPEAIPNPKKHLRDLVYIRSGHKTRYVNSIHNVKIAEACKVPNLRRCLSFRPLEDFLRAYL